MTFHDCELMMYRGKYVPRNINMKNSCGWVMGCFRYISIAMALVVLGIVVFALNPALASVSNLTYHLHNETSAINVANRQLRIINPDVTATTIQGPHLNTLGELVIANFETQKGDPNWVGTIPARSTWIFNIWYNESAMGKAVVYPKVKVYKNSISGTSILTSQSATRVANSTTMTKYSWTGTNSSSVSITSGDRIFIVVAGNCTAVTGTNQRFRAGVEGTTGGNTDSTIVVPIDKSLPATNITSIPPSPDGLAGWFKTVPTVTLTRDEPGTTEYSWISSRGPWTAYLVPFAADTGSNILYYHSRDAAGNIEQVKSQVFKVDTGNPSSNITAPANEAMLRGASYTVTGTSIDNGASGTSKVEVSINGGVWQLTNGKKNWSYTWTLPADGSYNIKSRATDIAGNVETAGSGANVIVDNTPPSVVSTYPVNSANEVAVETGVKTTFSEAVDTSTINTTSFTLKDELNNSINGTVTYDAVTKTATFTPSANLASKTSYVATMTTSVKDITGNSLAADYSWIFQTKDVIPPITTLSTDPVSPDGTNDWFKTTPTIFLTSSEPGTTYYSWASNIGPWTTYATPFATLAGQNTLHLYSQDTTGNVETVKSQNIKVDSEIPSSFITAPAANAKLRGATYTITGTATDSGESGLSHVEVSINDGTWQLVSGTNSWTYTWTIGDDGPYNIRSRATDAAGNSESAQVSIDVTIDNTAPIVTSTHPTNGTTNVSVSDSISTILNEDMDTQTINESNFIIMDKKNNRVSGAIYYDESEKKITMKPEKALEYSRSYTATLKKEIKDLTGNGLDNDYVFQFNTEPVARAEEPVVAIHVSEYTSALHGMPGSPALISDPQGWYYDSFWHFQAYELLEEALKSDGTPYVEISDYDIENGRLIENGKPRYPIVFSMMAESISDMETLRIKEYVSNGGTIYLNGSWGIRDENGLYRMSPKGTAEIALSYELGIESLATTLNPQGGSWSWTSMNTIRVNSDNDLVKHFPKNANMIWPLPKKYDSDAFNMLNVDNGYHPVWATREIAANPADILAVVASEPNRGYTDFPLLTTKDYGRGALLYHAEMAPLAGWGGFAPDTFEYDIFRKAISQAFHKCYIPVAKVAPWPYPYHAAFQTRWDMDFYPGDIRYLVQIEKARGVQGQYYCVTSLSNDNGGWVNWGQTNGALIGSHNSVHTGPDTQNPSDADSNIRASLDTLQKWLGHRPDTWVAPKYQGIKDQSFQVLENNGIKAAGEQNIGPFPHFSLSMTTPGKHYDVLQVPTSEWVPNSYSNADARARIDQFTTTQIIDAVDYYYDLGGVINIYGHPYTTNESRLQTYIDRAKTRPDVWFTNSRDIYNWWSKRDEVSINSHYAVNDDIAELTITINGSTDPNQAVDVTFPYLIDNVPADLNVIIDGLPSLEYKYANSGLSMKTGTAHELLIRWKADAPVIDSDWLQTSQQDFERGELTNADSASSPGDVYLLDSASGGPYFWEDFQGTDKSWMKINGRWAIDEGLYKQLDISSGYKLSYSGNSSWTDHILEAKTQCINGAYGGQIAGRLNPLTGARYSLWLYQSTNQLKLIKFSDWTNWTQMGATVTVPAIGNSWHDLKLEFNGAQIKAYYDNVLYLDVQDNSYTKGAIAVETYGSEVAFDDIKVTTANRLFSPEGALTSEPFDSGSDDTQWTNVSWNGSNSPGTSTSLRTRTATSREGLDTADWSGFYPTNIAVITSPGYRWIQYQVVLTTQDTSNTPVLNDVLIEYQRPIDLIPPSPPDNIQITSGSESGVLNLNWVNPADPDFDNTHIYRSETPGVLGRFIFDDIGGNQKTDSGLINGTTYYYTLRSVDQSSNESTNTAQYSGIPEGGV